MGLSKIVLPLLLTVSLLAAEPNRVLYLIRQGHFQQAIKLYEEKVSTNGAHDYEILQQIGLTLIELGWKCKDGEIKLLSLFGAGISAHDQAQYLLEDAIKSDEPRFQQVALNFLSKNYTDDSSRFLNFAMRSDFLPIRLEAVFHMAQKQHPKAAYQIESLMYKVPPEALPLFPQLLAASGDKDSILMLRRMMSHRLLPVRLQAILSAARGGRDDLLVEIRGISSHHSVEEQEATAVALGILKDETSINRLKQLASSHTKTVQIAALQALNRLGRDEAAHPLIKLARSGDLFAIYALGEVNQSEETLYELCRIGDLNIRVNAALALLERRDPRCLPTLLELFVRDPRDLALSQINSIGKGLLAYKVVPSAQQNFESAPLLYEQTLNLKERTLQKTLELPERNFLEFATLLLEKHQNELIPTITHLLEELRSAEAILILKHYREQLGAPLIRYWCNLALYRMKEEGPYTETLKAWVKDYQYHDLIQFRPMLPWKMRTSTTQHYQLTPQETSRLLVETYESLVQQQDEEGIALILDAIKSGNRKNRYALAGLLIRATN